LPATVAWGVLFASLALGGCASAPGPRAAHVQAAMSLQAFAKLQQDAAVAYARGNAPVATALYTELARRAPDDAQAWRRLGNLELLAGNDARALLAYEHVVQLGGAGAVVWHNMAVIRLHQAQAALAQVQAQAPDPGDAALRADSARAAQALPQVLRMLVPGMPSAPAPSPGPSVPGAQREQRP
jgi:tetratricopeptide (TPR) repeat protein